MRLEVDRGMPPVLRALLLEDVRREHVGMEAPCLVTDVEEVDGLLDLRGLTELELPRRSDGELSATRIAPAIQRVGTVRDRHSM